MKSALVAALLALFGILVYVAFRYEFSFAVGAVVAIIHDILMTMGWFFLSGRELSAPIVAAILTIIGFSINDTIVIFDRIREDLKLGVRGSFREVMNQALNQTLSRTIITSGTVFLATMSLYLLGGGVINDFAFTFLVGIVTGTYSSIYIASALVLWWHKGERPISSSQVVMDSAVTARGVMPSMLAEIEISPWHWVGFISVILIFLALDLGVFHRQAHVIKFQEALAWTVVWFAVAMAFALFLAPMIVETWGREETIEFITGYIIELSLSMDNVFVIALIFAYFCVPLQFQHRVLFLGYFGRFADAGPHDLARHGIDPAVCLDAVCAGRVPGLYRHQNDLCPPRKKCIRRRTR